MTLGDDGRWHPVKRAPEPSMIFPTDEENQPKYIDMRSPVADSGEGSTLKVYAEMRRTIETFKSLAGLAVGLGKSHLASARGYEACQRVHSVLFTTAVDALNNLVAAQRLNAELKRYLTPAVLIFDELN